MSPNGQMAYINYGESTNGENMILLGRNVILCVRIDAWMQGPGRQDTRWRISDQ